MLAVAECSVGSGLESSPVPDFTPQVSTPANGFAAEVPAAANSAPGREIVLPEEAPGEVDLEIYEAVRIEGYSQRTAAMQFNLSQPAVCKAVRRVTKWISEHTADVRMELTEPQRLRLAEDTYRRRLDALFYQAMEAWRNSQCDQITAVIKPDANGIGRRTSREFRSFGKPQYLMVAEKLAARMARFVGLALTPADRVAQAKLETRLSAPVAAEAPAADGEAGLATQPAAAPDVAPVVTERADRHGRRIRTEKRVIRPGSPEDQVLQEEFDKAFASMFGKK